MRNAIEIEELIKDTTHGNKSLFSVIEEYEKKLEDCDEDRIEELEMKISFMRDHLKKTIEEIERLLDLLDGDTRKLNKRHSNKIIKNAEYYL